MFQHTNSETQPQVSFLEREYQLSYFHSWHALLFLLIDCKLSCNTENCWHVILKRENWNWKRNANIHHRSNPQTPKLCEAKKTPQALQLTDQLGGSLKSLIFRRSSMQSSIGKICLACLKKNGKRSSTWPRRQEKLNACPKACIFMTNFEKN